MHLYSPTAMLSAQMTLEGWRSLGADDTVKGNSPRPLPGIAEGWVIAYLQGHEGYEAPETNPEMIPF
ncbi:hypothetical protein [Thermoleptolyngbya sp.]